ncbi:MAG: zinc-binding alcohol dehydrogenase [Waddliaceae bacterium]|nr:zinc-binding alcohol dehydrogenase [Waddliaceae bacterium]
MRAATIVSSGQALEIQERAIPKPIGKEVLIKVEAAGVCHSDLHFRDGAYQMGGGRILQLHERGVNYPLIPGHEVAGTVEACGESVLEFSLNERVLVYPWMGCTICRSCELGDEHLCVHPKSLGLYQSGGYAEYILVPDMKYLVPIGDLAVEMATTLACSGLTAYTAVKKVEKTQAQNVVLIGMGGLGLCAIQLLAYLFKDIFVVAVDVDDRKLEEAQRLGADSVINSKTEEAVEEIKKLCGGGADCVIDFVNMSATASLGFSCLRKRGSLILVGLFGGDLTVSLPLFPMMSISIEGAYTGRLSDLHKLVQLAQKGVLQPLVSKSYSLDEVNQALNDLENGKVLGRALLKP